MKKILTTIHQKRAYYPILLLLISAIVYLPLINRLGFLGDDWLFIYDAHSQGVSFIATLNQSDRPARTILLEPAYLLFGNHLPYYLLASFGFLFIGALAFFWMLNIVWPGKRRPNFLMAFFFMLYPGFLMQFYPTAMPHVVSISLAMLSIAFTVKALQTQKTGHKILFAVAAVATGWFYLALVEYFIGIEFLRLFFVALLTWQNSSGMFKEKTFKSFLKWLPFAIIPIAFLVWRVFFFKSTRVATDIGAHLENLTLSPGYTGLKWATNMLYSIVNIVFSVWIVPFYNVFKALRLRDLILTLSIGFVGTIITMVGLFVWRKPGQESEEENGSNWMRLAMLGGFLSVLVGIVPIILVNRYADMDYARYTLASAPGAIMMLVSGLYSLSSRLRTSLVGFLVFILFVAHFGNAMDRVVKADALRDFWWQVSWRAPQIERGTTLITEYSLMEAPEDYIIWGPANLIYYPDKQDIIPVRIQLPAAIPNDETVNSILGNGKGNEIDRRGNLVDVSFGSMLIITQADSNTCVRILDGSIPELSMNDSSEIKLISSYSQIDRIMLDAAPASPPESIFGPEPEHKWCFYYQKAALARQSEDWQSIIAFGEQAKAYGYSPIDRIEWLPFLQAYVVLRQTDELEAYSGIMNEFPLVRHQTCQVLMQTASRSHPEDLELQTLIDQKYCHLP